MNLPNMTFPQLMDFVTRGAQENFHRDGKVVPLVFAIDGGNNLLIAETAWADDDERVTVLKGLRQLFQERDVQYYVSVNEAWRRVVGPGDDLSLQPSKAENRTEVIIIAGTDGDEQKCRTFEINRPFDGGPATLVELDVNEIERFGGALYSLLDWKSPRTMN